MKTLWPGPRFSFSAFADFLWNLKKHFLDLSIKLSFIFLSSFRYNLNIKILRILMDRLITLVFYYTDNWNKSSYYRFTYIALYFYYIIKNHRWTVQVKCEQCTILQINTAQICNVLNIFTSIYNKFRHSNGINTGNKMLFSVNERRFNVLEEIWAI